VRRAGGCGVAHGVQWAAGMMTGMIGRFGRLLGSLVAFAALGGCEQEEPVFAIEAGRYALEFGVNGGSCGDSNIDGVVKFLFAEVDPTTEPVFTLTVDGGLDDVHSFDCDLDDRAFTCTGPEVELMTRTEPMARTVMQLSATGEWIAEDEFVVVITGELSCSGDGAACEDYDATVELQTPCEMVNEHTGVHTG
jgi:hypothetical protein